MNLENFHFSKIVVQVLQSTLVTSVGKMNYEKSRQILKLRAIEWPYFHNRSFTHRHERPSTPKIYIFFNIFQIDSFLSNQTPCSLGHNGHLCGPEIFDIEVNCIFWKFDWSYLKVCGCTQTNQNWIKYEKSSIFKIVYISGSIFQYLSNDILVDLIGPL